MSNSAARDSIEAVGGTCDAIWRRGFEVSI